MISLGYHDHCDQGTKKSDHHQDKTRMNGAEREREREREGEREGGREREGQVFPFIRKLRL